VVIPIQKWVYKDGWFRVTTWKIHYFKILGIKTSNSKEEENDKLFLGILNKQKRKSRDLRAGMEKFIFVTDLSFNHRFEK